MGEFKSPVGEVQASTAVKVEEKPRSVQERVEIKALTVWDANEIPHLHELIRRESGYRPDAVNKTSGACGLFQAYPCKKMGGMEVENQINWGVNYVLKRYQTPEKALRFQIRNGWY